MCRALLYLGKPVLLDNLLFQPDSALVRQSYMPKMLHMMNLAGFGIRAWDPGSHDPAAPFAYASDSLPVFDRNLKNLATKVAAGCVLAHVRGVAYSTQVEISLQNVHPFQFPGMTLALAHNGDLARIAEMRPGLAKHLRPELARQIRGTTDSEWIYALVLSQLEDPQIPATGAALVAAISKAIAIIRDEREARHRCVVIAESLRTDGRSPRCATASTSAATRRRRAYRNQRVVFSLWTVAATTECMTANGA